METMPATTPRLVLLLKSGPGTGTSIAHKGGYALYGNPPRWRKITADKPAPKGAPVAAHPKSAGHHDAADHLTDEQWAALKLPDSNVNAPVFNKALEKLRAWSDAGDVTAIVGAQYGTNTYGAKLAKIANHLLGLHGSAHTVTPGQKPGTHAAAQVAEPADPHPTGLPEHLAPKAAEPAEDTQALKDKLEVLHDFLSAKPDSPNAPAWKAKIAEIEAKIGPLKTSKPEPVKTEVDTSSWSDPAKAAHALNTEYKALDKLNNKAVGAFKTKLRALAKKTPEDDAHATLILDGLVTKLWGTDYDPKVAGVEFAPAKPAAITPASAETVATGTVFEFSSQYEKMNAGKWVVYNTSPDGQHVYMHKVGAKVPNQTNSATIPAATLAEAVANGTAKKQAAPQVAAAPAAPEAEIPASTPTASGALSTQQLQNLQSIPWFKLKLPAENTNAKSHNAALAKIESMAFAGHVAGLKAFADGKAGAKQTYAKKQYLLAVTAIAALQGGWAAPALAGGHAVVSVSESDPAVIAAANDLNAIASPSPAQTHIFKAITSGEYPAHVIKNSAGKIVAAASFGVDKDGHIELDQLGSTVPGGGSALVAAAKDLAKQKGVPLMVTAVGDSTGFYKKQGFTDAQGGSGRMVFGAAAPAPAAATVEPGPQEGDTKQGADGMLVLKNGHWVKQEAAAPAKVKKATLIDISTAIQTISPGQTKFSTNGAGKLATAAAKKGDGAGMAQAYAKAHAMSFPKTASHIKAVAQAMGVDTSGWNDGTGPATAPAAPPAATVSTGGMISMDTWAQTGGQGGSNPGGKFKDPSGQEWYCKWPDDAEAAKSEVLAAKLYALAGLSSQDCMLVSKGGKTAIATKWVDIKKAATPGALAKADGAQSGFAVDAWLGNWDVVGLGYDNLQIGPDGKAHRVDAGGSLEYRAQGEKKPFGSKVDELDTLLNANTNPQAASVFKGMTQADLTASAAKVLAISDVAIRAMVNQYGPGDAAAKAKLADTLIARKADLAKRFPAAVKKKKAPVFKPEDISAPPSFLNWGGKGSSGPSSKEFLNKANEEAVQAIFAAAKTGDLDAIKGLKAKVYDKDTGQVTGEKPVLEHPSQHVKGYAQQAVNEINYQLNPPKKFRFDGGHPLHSLNSLYPAHKGAASSAAAQKLGKFIVLGEPGVVKLEEVGLPEKITHAEGGGTLSVHTYAKQAQAAIAKMPATQKQAVKSYTGSSYGAMNSSLWDGNPTGAAKAAGEALKTLGHDIAPGTVLSRQLSLHGENLKAVLGSVGKILQEPAIMSTSIRPSSWVKNVQLKLHVGPGVKGLWVGHHSLPGGGALSSNSGEDEMILPPGTRLLVMSVRSGGKDADGFGAHGQAHVIEAIILPTE